MFVIVFDVWDMFIVVVQSLDLVMYIDDCWCYEFVEDVQVVVDVDICLIVLMVRCIGWDVIVVVVSFLFKLVFDVVEVFVCEGIDVEVIDVWQINLFNLVLIIDFVV